MEGNKIYIFFFINPGKNFAIRSLEYLLWIFWSSSWSLSADAVCPVYSVSEVNDEPWKSTPRKSNNMQTGTYKEWLAQMQLFSKLCELILLLQTNLVNQQLQACSPWKFFSIFSGSLYGLRWWQKRVIDTVEKTERSKRNLCDYLALACYLLAIMQCDTPWCDQALTQGGSYSEMAAAGSQISLVYLGAKYIYCTRSSLKGNFIYSPLVELGTNA